MKRMNAKWLSCGALLSLMATTAQAQTQRAIERRMERNERQLQRQVNQADYYTDQTWQQIDPWIQRNGVAPLARAANAARTAAGVAGNVVAGAVDAADGQLNDRFGYSNNNAQNTWFYDYYSYTPTYYQTPGENNRYAGAIRYFDNDRDGVYESQSIYRDSDDDGNYDEYDRLDFYAPQPQVAESTPRTTQPAEAQANVAQQNDYRGPEDARRHEMQGEIAAIKTAKVNGQENLLVGLKQQNQEQLAIDLGPAEALRGQQIEVGSSIVATGALDTVGDKQLLVADSVRVNNGQSITIRRNAGQTLNGTIVDITETKIGSTTHYLAVVESNGERQLVDLGATTTFKQRLEPSTQIVIQGIPVRTRDHRVILADRVELGGQVIEVNRAQSYAF